MCSAFLSMMRGNFGVMFVMFVYVVRVLSMYLCNSVLLLVDVVSCWSKFMMLFVVLRKLVNICSRRVGCMDNFWEFVFCGMNVKNVYKYNNLVLFDM